MTSPERRPNGTFDSIIGHPVGWIEQISDHAAFGISSFISSRRLVPRLALNMPIPVTLPPS